MMVTNWKAFLDDEGSFNPDEKNRKGAGFFSKN
jgi:hypothetical protein